MQQLYPQLVRQSSDPIFGVTQTPHSELATHQQAINFYQGEEDDGDDILLRLRNEIRAEISAEARRILAELPSEESFQMNEV